MPTLLRFLRRPTVLAALAMAIVATLAFPASAGAQSGRSGEITTRDSHPLRQAFTDLMGRTMAVPDVDAAVRLHCAPRVNDRAAAVACEWNAGDDVAVRSWQLWNLQVRPAADGRNLVVQTGADVQSHLDTEVTAPAVYIYAVLGLDADGEIIARSRLRAVTLVPDGDEADIEPMRLECAPHRTGTDRAPSVVVGCEWREVTGDEAVGYVVWRSVDGAARTPIARVGLETTTIRDDDVAFGQRYAYVVTAVDAAGDVVGRSRVETVGISPVDRPTRPAPADRAVDDRAVEDRAVEDRAVEDRAVEDRAVEDEVETVAAAEAVPGPVRPEPIARPAARSHAD